VGRDSIDISGHSTAALDWREFRSLPMTRAATPAVESSEPLRAGTHDVALVQAFAEGRREAFDDIVARYRRTVYVVCYRFTGNHDDAADIAQDVFVRAFKGLARFKRESSLGTWFYRVAVNTCLSHAAVQKPEMEPVDRIDRADVNAPNPLDAVERDELRGRLQRAIRQLPPRQRATVILRVYQDLSHEEIARILGSTAGASKTNLFHALATLRRLLTS
jgi:RNA polymerase sigma-70 factor (ECF subfamily)